MANFKMDDNTAMVIVILVIWALLAIILIFAPE